MKNNFLNIDESDTKINQQNPDPVS